MLSSRSLALASGLALALALPLACGSSDDEPSTGETGPSGQGGSGGSSAGAGGASQGGAAGQQASGSAGAGGQKPICNNDGQCPPGQHCSKGICAPGIPSCVPSECEAKTPDCTICPDGSKVCSSWSCSTQTQCTPQTPPCPGAGGASGSGGASGASGASGNAGASGASGASGTAGSSGTGGSADWASCGAPSDCALAPKGCCATCSVPTVADLDSVNKQKIAEHHTAVCPDPTPCPGCASQPNPDLLAVCALGPGQCGVLEISKSVLSECKVDEDCALRFTDCCQCMGSSSSLAAIATSQESTYSQIVCDPASDCPPCAPVYPAGYAAVCGADGHCRVKAP